MGGKLDVKTQVDLLNNEIEFLKPLFEEYIKDKSIPLDERWETFKKANNGLSYHKPFWVDFPGDEHEISWYDDFSIERYETVNLVQFLEDTLPEMIRDLEEDGKDIDPTDTFYINFYERRKYLFSRFNLNDWKEYILSINTKSAEYDW